MHVYICESMYLDFYKVSRFMSMNENIRWVEVDCFQFFFQEDYRGKVVNCVMLKLVSL